MISLLKNVPSQKYHVPKDVNVLLPGVRPLFWRQISDSLQTLTVATYSWCCGRGVPNEVRCSHWSCYFQAESEAHKGLARGTEHCCIQVRELLSVHCLLTPMHDTSDVEVFLQIKSKGHSFLLGQ